MRTELSEGRRNEAVRLLLIAAAMAVVAAVTLGIEARSTHPDAASGPVVPGLAEAVGGGQRITIVSGEASYRIERVNRGEQEAWVMRDRGDYPVLAARLAQLTQGLQDLTYVRRMTSDASKHARLGVDDPRQGGRGVLVQIEDMRGAFLVNLILGVETGGLYARRPDDDQTWAVRGELPPLRDIAAWLELAPLALDPNDIARVEIVPNEGPAYILARELAGGEFTIVRPRRDAVAASVVAAAAERITQVAPIDVQPAPAIQGAPRARVRAQTFSGVIIDAELIDSGEHTWLKLVARAETPEQEAVALEINNQASAWAYALSENEAAALAPPLANLLPGPPPALP